MNLRIYVYKITFLDVPYYYYGVHKEKIFNEEYFGSPVTHKHYWKKYTPQKQILKEFNYSDEGWIFALHYEKELIKPVYNIDKFCLNENYNGFLSLETLRKSSKIGGNTTFNMKVGVHQFNSKQKSEFGKIGGYKTSSQKWKCLETGFISNPASLTLYQKKRNIDIKKRERIF
jgi:hypothetical protein